MLFHLGDAYFFMNEVIKTQPTSHEESALFSKLLDENKRANRLYGRATAASIILPYLYACGTYRGYLWKGLAFYLIYNQMDAIYDFGMYLGFFIKGPRQMREVLALDPSTSFASI
jgi:hypothetical protein